MLHTIEIIQTFHIPYVISVLFHLY
jgi:hypothetical protein